MIADRRPGDERKATAPGQAARSTASLPSGWLAGLQQTAGNAAVVQMLRRTGYLSEPDAEPAAPQKDAGAGIAEVVSRGGSPLDETKRKRAESVFQEDFSDVRVHTDAVAQRSAQNVQARAYTVGNNIVSGTGSIDDRTLYHELTHVSQQRKGPVAGTDRGDGVRVSDPRDPFEQAASANERLADAPAPTHHHAGDGHAHHHGSSMQRSTASPTVAQRAKKNGGQQDESAQEPRRRVLVVCDESGLGLGGVPVFNMELVKGLHHDHDVTLLTVDNHADYDHAKMTGQHGGATIVNASVPGVEEGRDRLDVVAQGSPGQYGLPSADDAFDIVIGHSRFSGPAAQKIRDAWYPGARVVHFLHTSPVRLDKIKHQPDKGARKATTERRLMHKADLVAGVGPLLAREAERLSEQILRIPALHGFVPGTEIGTPVDPSLLNKTKYLLHLPRKLKLLLPGRATDEIKGVDAAVRAIGILRRPRAQGGHGLDVRLTIRGGPHPEKNPAEHAQWTSIINTHGAGGVTMLPFSTSSAELERDRETTHALIMPSLHEGFGLVATEAAGRSIPVLVNGESGAAEFLQQVSRQGAGMTVDAPFNIDSGSGTEVEGGTDQRAQAWAAAISTLRDRLPAARDEAGQLYEILKSFTWRHAAQALVAATMATAEPLRATERPEQHPHRGAVTQQGPDGTYKTLKDRSDWQPHDFWDGSTPQPTTGLWSEAEQLARLSELAGVLDLSGGAPPAARAARRTNTA